MLTAPKARLREQVFWTTRFAAEGEQLEAMIADPSGRKPVQKSARVSPVFAHANTRVNSGSVAGLGSVCVQV